jgi:hypothetical protein
MKCHLFAIALCLAHSSLQAQDVTPVPTQAAQDGNGRPYSYLFGMGITGGGDKLATANFTNGSTQNIDAGGLIYLKAGADWRVGPNMSIQGTFGYHTDLVNANNGDLKFNRTFVEGLAFWGLTPTQRIGFGARQTFGAKLSSSGAASTVGNIEFKGNVGAVLEYEWLFSKRGNSGSSITVRLVSEKYTPDKFNGRSVTGKDVDGSHVGLGFNLYF